MLLAAAVLLTVGAIAYTLVVRDRDLPRPEPKTGYEHLEERRARIYEALRDLQFEFRVGKLSESDYQRTKLNLQGELAAVMAELDAAKGVAAAPAKPKTETGNVAPVPGTVCPHCNAKFPTPLKFCGECGKAMTA
jgi:hypothetical protein